MTPITTTAELAALCHRLAAQPFVTVDTEFMRESTYWPKLCLVQLAGKDEAAAIDPLAPALELTPLSDLLAAPDTLKVFHAARQDVEIFYHLDRTIPAPLFDTQLAAMVCGFGESVGYETLVSRLLNERIDKTSQFTDWSRRPLTARQLSYALDDVVHLRAVYDKLRRQLENSGRTAWLDEEMAVLTDPATHALHPEAAWRRIKTRNTNPRFLGVLQEVAAWREVEAQTHDKPRNWLMKDEALLHMAGHPPRRAADLGHVRALPRSFAEGKHAEQLLAAVARGLERPDEELPDVDKPRTLPRGLAPLVELLKVLLKMKCEANDVAQKLVASTADLERLAWDDRDAVPALKGWRFEIFGRDALALKHGEVALAADGRQVQLIPLGEPGADRRAATRRN